MQPIVEFQIIAQQVTAMRLITSRISTGQSAARVQPECSSQRGAHTGDGTKVAWDSAGSNFKPAFSLATDPLEPQERELSGGRKTGKEDRRYMHRAACSVLRERALCLLRYVPAGSISNTCLPCIRRSQNCRRRRHLLLTQKSLKISPQQLFLVFPFLSIRSKTGPRSFSAPGLK